MVDLETIEALYENVGGAIALDQRNIRVHVTHVFMIYLQRVQPEELERIKHHYETSEEEEVKLLDKPEQSVSPLLTDTFRVFTRHYLRARSSGE